MREFARIQETNYLNYKIISIVSLNSGNYFTFNRLD